MKIFPHAWGRPDAGFEIVSTPEEPCTACGAHFTEKDIGVVIPHVHGPMTDVDPGGVADLPWHRGCLLENLGIVEEDDDVFYGETYTVDKLKKDS